MPALNCSENCVDQTRLCGELWLGRVPITRQGASSAAATIGRITRVACAIHWKRSRSIGTDTATPSSIEDKAGLLAHVVAFTRLALTGVLAHAQAVGGSVDYAVGHLNDSRGRLVVGPV